MGEERLRICRQVGRGERVLVLFCGCGPEVLQVGARTGAIEVVGVDSNTVAIECAKRGVRKLQERREKATQKEKDHEGKGEEEATMKMMKKKKKKKMMMMMNNTEAICQNISMLEGDVMTILPELVSSDDVETQREREEEEEEEEEEGEGEEVRERQKEGRRRQRDSKHRFDRVIVPRPKGKNEDRDKGRHFLVRLFESKVLKIGATVHWYDFATAQEVPECARTRKWLTNICEEYGFGT